MFKKNLIALIIVFIFPIIALAQQSINIPDMKAVVPPDPNIKIGTLSNGLKYYIKENKKPEKRMELFLIVNAGAVLEDDDQNGLAHFCEHMAFNGTKSFPKNKLVDFLELAGVKFGPDLNAFTSYDETVYMLQIPTDKPELITDGFKVLEEWSHLVTYDDTEIDKERGVILEEWRLGKGAEDRCDKKNRKVVYHDSRYVERDVIGDTNIITKAPYDALRRFYRDWYRPDLMAVVAVGDFDAKDVETRIKAGFSGLVNPKNERSRTEYPMPAHKKNYVTIAKDKELGYPSVNIYFKREGKTEENYETFKQDITSRLFSRMLTKRLDEYRNKPNPPFTYYAGASDGKFEGKDSKCFTVFGLTRSNTIKYCTETLLKETFRAMQHGFTQTEFDRIKEETLRDMEQSYAEKDKTESQRYAFEFMRNFLQKEVIPGISTELELYKKWLPEISLDEINKLSSKLIRKENVVIAITAPDNDSIAVPEEKEIKQLFEDISEANTSAYIDEVSDKPLFTKELKEGLIAGETRHVEVGVTEFLLQNGINVVLKPSNFKNDEILFTAYSKGGTSVVPDSDYISAMYASSIINQSGIGSFDNIQLQKKLAGKVVSVYPYINELSQNIEGSCSTKDLETMLQLVYMYFTEPRKDTTTFKSYIEKLKSEIKDSKNEPRSIWYDTVRTTLTRNHFRYLPMTEEKINSINLDKAYNFYKECFSDAGNFTFIFVGNFDLNNMKDILTKYLGNLPTKHEKHTFRDLGIYPPKGLVYKSVYKGIEAQSYVWLSFSGSFQWNFDTRYSIEALEDALDIRLREVLREDKGGVYGVGAWGEPQLNPHTQYKFSITFGCDPKRVDELVNATLDVIKKMQDSTLDSIYVNKIKETQKRERETQLKENDSWLKLLKSYLFNDDRPTAILAKDKRIAKLTAEEIKKAAQTYLDLDSFTKIVLYPEGFKKETIKK